MRRLAGTALLILGTGLVFLSIRSLLAQSHAAQVSTLSRWTPNHPAAVLAARRASTLTPWDASARKDLAWKLASRQSHEARAQMQTALMWAPADAYLWNDYARLLVRQRRFGSETERVSTHALSLAPHSAALHAGNAWMAIHYWTWASADLQTLWLHSLRREWRRDRDRLTREILASRRTQVFCLGPGARLPATQAWCAGAPWD